MRSFVCTLLFIVILISSCKKESSFSPIPVITFKSFVAYNNDSADCIIGFKDGDGDIGIFTGDTSSPDNLKMKYLYKNSQGDFVPYDVSFGTTQFDTLFYTFRIKNITPDGQYKALEGDIKIKLRAAPIFVPTHKVVKFNITLWDRAGHQSNTVTTNEILVNL